jgi:hypothetical protein
MLLLLAVCYHGQDGTPWSSILTTLTKRPQTKLKATQTTPNLKPNLNNTGKTRRP